MSSTKILPGCLKRINAQKKSPIHPVACMEAIKTKEKIEIRFKKTKSVNNRKISTKGARQIQVNWALEYRAPGAVT